MSAPPPLRVCLLSGAALSSTHGTGAQMLRVFSSPLFSTHHLYWRSTKYGRSEVVNSYLLEDPLWRWRKGGRHITRVKAALRLLWWYGNAVSKPKLRALLREKGVACDVAYVVVSDETEAMRALSLLAVLGCPYVVHLMDLEHEEGLDPASMPGYGKLLGGAARVLALNEALAAEARKFPGVDVRVVAFGHALTPDVARALSPQGPVRLLLSGNIHPLGVQALAEALPLLAAQVPQLEIVYAGGASHVLPSALRRIARDCGYLAADEYERLVGTCHLAYLTGPDQANHLSRFSIPSRLADYLMYGLPTLGFILPGSAADHFTRPLVPDVVRVTLTPPTIADAVFDWTSSPARWQAASRRAREFAARYLSLDAVRAQVFAALRDAAERA